MTTTPPEGLSLERNRDLVGLEQHPWTRWALLAVLSVPIVLGLVNAFGQRPDTTTASGSTAELEVYAPSRVRGGIVYEARFTVRALSEIKAATIVLDSGWLEGMTLNTAEPSPVDEDSRDGRIAFSLGPVPAGEKHVLYLDFQVNPTNVGRRSADVDLYDGPTLLTHLDRTVTVFP